MTNREILFRGKRVDGKGWVYGDLIHAGEKFTNSHHILHWEEGTTYPVIPETVGQFTGLTDKNGTKIFEGDIIGRTGFFDRIIKSDHVGLIEYSIHNPEGINRLHPQSFDEYDEITSNIHDNPTT